MCEKLLECISVWDVTSLFIGAILSASATIILIKLFRPKICFHIPYIENKIIKMPVENLSKCFTAVNLRIEAAAVLNDYTYHLDLDRQDFIMLSRNILKKNNETPFKRTYQASAIANYTKQIAPECQNIDDFLKLLSNKEAYLRIRIHGYHEFTGFGKAFEAQFEFANDMFKPKSNKYIC